MLGGWLYIELIWLVQERLSNKELEMAQKNGFLGGPKIAILFPERTTSPRLSSESCFWIWGIRVIA